MRSDFLSGFRDNLPVAASAMAYGSVLGVLASQKGLTWLDMVYMNTAVFAGAAQFVMVDMWSEKLPVFEMAIAVLVINLRYLLIGASLSFLFEGRKLREKVLFMHLVADENWAVTMARSRVSKVTPYFLLGGGVCCYMAWSGGTLAGLLGGASISNPESYALDYAFTAVFTALALGLWRGGKDVLPWVAAGVLALVTEKLFPGKWYIVAGGLGGAVTAVFTAGEQNSGNVEGEGGGHGCN